MMKVNFKIIILFLTVALFSCEDKDLIIAESTPVANRIPGPQPTVGYGDIFSLYLNNGLTTTCAKNILVFPSWVRYYQVIDNLDADTEVYCDAFDAQQPAGQSEADYEAACNFANFDEDKKIVQFENNLAFCSLRKKLLTLEEAWLNVQGDGQWDLSNDPESHFIEDDTERAILNEGVEVIVGKGTREEPYILYKFNDDGGFYTIPVVGISGGSVMLTAANQTSVIQLNNGTFAGNPAIVLSPPRLEPPTVNCKSKARDKGNVYSGNNRIKWKGKAVRENGANHNNETFTIKGKIVAKTINYKKGNFGWRRSRAWIKVGIEGTSLDACGSPILISKFKEKRRRKVKVVHKINPFDGSSPVLHYLSFPDNSLYSRHFKGSVFDISKDYYDM